MTDYLACNSSSAKKAEHSADFIRPQQESGMMTFTTERGTTFLYDRGTLYRVEGARREILSEGLPRAEWYELVELAQSPFDPAELWISIGGRELHCSRDGGRTFSRCAQVTHVADMGFVPTLHSDRHYSFYFFGVIGAGRPAGYVSLDLGESWTSYDATELLPLS